MEEFLKKYGSWLLLGGFSIIMIGVHLWSARTGHAGCGGARSNDSKNEKKDTSGDKKTHEQKQESGCH